MKGKTVCAVLGCIALGVATNAAAQEAKAEFVDAQGKPAGGAMLRQMPGGVLIRLDLSGLPPGEHAFHIHEAGRCDPKDGFKTAGGHYGPGKRAHGYLAKGRTHAGDMPNQFVGDDGRLRAEVFNPNVRLTEKSLLDKDGAALVIHAKPDDYKSQPAGDAGDRIACAVIKRG